MAKLKILSSDGGCNYTVIMHQAESILSELKSTDQKLVPFICLTLDSNEIDPNKILDHILPLQSQFTTSSLTSGFKPYVDPERRNSLSLRNNIFIQDLGKRIQAEIDKDIHTRLSKLGINQFKQGHTSIVCLSYPNGTYFKRHNDYISNGIHRRIYTWVYFFHTEPKAYRGGELVFYKNDTETGRITPQNGTLVIFSAGIPHEVLKVEIDSDKFSDSRFCITGFVYDQAPLPIKVQRYIAMKVKNAPLPKPVISWLRYLYGKFSLNWR